MTKATGEPWQEFRWLLNSFVLTSLKWLGGDLGGNFKNGIRKINDLQTVDTEDTKL
jgi:hypothetical protein